MHVKPIEFPVDRVLPLAQARITGQDRPLAAAIAQTLDELAQLKAGTLVAENVDEHVRAGTVTWRGDKLVFEPSSSS